MDKELLELSDKYFESVKPIVDNIPKNYGIAFIGCIPLVITMLVFWFLLVGAMHFMLGRVGDDFKGYEQMVDSLVQKTSFGTPLFWSIVITFLSIFTIGFTIKMFLFLSKKTVGKKDAIENFSFCHLYRCVDDIKLFLVNEQQHHLISAKKFLDKYLNSGEYTSNVYNSDEKRIHIHNALASLEGRYSWLKITDNSKSILLSYKDFKSKINERIKQETDIEIVNSILKKLLIYEFLKSNPGSLKAFLKPKGLDNKELRNKYIYELAQMVNSLDELAFDNENNLEKQLFTKRLKDTISNLFTGGNIVAVFLSWYGLILVLLFGISHFGCSFLQIPFDSKILVGIITTPFIVSTSITIAMITRKQK